MKFEAYLATQFVNIINLLKGFQDPEDSSKTLFDTTLMLWARDMGDADQHNQQSMRFVLASGSNGGYLKTAAGGRYIKSTSATSASCSTSARRWASPASPASAIPGLTGTAKTPLPNIAA